MFSDKTYTSVIATTLVVKIIDEKAFFPVLKAYTHHAEPSIYDRVAFLDHFSRAPLKVPEMGHSVAGSQKKTRFHHFYYTSM